MSTKQLQIVGGIIPQSDWGQEDSTQRDYIKNKPTSLPAQGGDADTVDGKHANDFLSVNGGAVTGNLTIGGNLTVNGTTTTVNSTTLQVTDKLIEVAHGNTAKLTTPAGLVAPKYDGTNSGALVFDGDGVASVGDVTLDANGNVDVSHSSLQPLATRTGLVGGHVPKWDATNQTLVDSGFTINKSVPANAQFTDTTYTAAGTSLGLVKSGGDVTISDGVISFNYDSHNHTIENIIGLQTALDNKQIAIVKTASGTFITLDDSADVSIQSLHAIGNSTQDGTPSMDNPIEINGIGKLVLGGDHNGKYAVNIHSRGKNLFNKADSAISAIRNETTGQFWGTSIFPAGYDIRRVFPEGQIVTVSFDVECTSIAEGATSISDGSRFGFSFLRSGTWYSYQDWKYLAVGEKRHISKVVTVPQNFDGGTVYWYSNRYNTPNGAYIGEMIFSNIQVELGNTETAYEPYVEDSEATLYLNEQMHGINNLHDELIVNVDGTGKLIRRFGKYVFDGTESFIGTSAGSRTVYYKSLPNAKTGNGNYACLCNYFEVGTYAQVANGTKSACFGSRSLSIYTNHNSAAEVKAWVKSLYDAGTPLIAVYQLDAPTETNLTASEVQAILALQTYKPNTTITAEGAELEVTYFTDSITSDALLANLNNKVDKSEFDTMQNDLSNILAKITLGGSI